MLLIELIQSYKWADVRYALLSLYPAENKNMVLRQKLWKY